MRTAAQNGLVNAGYVDMTIPLSAGGLYSTTEDLLRWEQGLFGGKAVFGYVIEGHDHAVQERRRFGSRCSTWRGMVHDQ